MALGGVKLVMPGLEIGGARVVQAARQRERHLWNWCSTAAEHWGQGVVAAEVLPTVLVVVRMYCRFS